MHELSIAVHLVELAGQEAARAGAAEVRRVFVRVGVLSGVVREALAFAFDVAAKDTLLEGATLEIEERPVVVYCPCCDQEKELRDRFALWCPDCNTPTPDIRGGRELDITALEITEQPSLP